LIIVLDKKEQIDGNVPAKESEEDKNEKGTDPPNNPVKQHVCNSVGTI